MRSLLKTSGLLLLTAAMIVSCKKSEPPLPIFGEREFDGKDTIFHTIKPFAFLDQDSMLVTNDTFKGKMYVADFFFTSCRTICPIMKTQMKRVYEATANDPDVLILSHTIDPRHDNVETLNNYARMLEVENDRWHFVTGERDSIYRIAQTSYFVTAREEQLEADGFIHSGAFLLIDKNQRIRGKYDGTREVDVDRLLKDIARLRKESE